MPSYKYPRPDRGLQAHAVTSGGLRGPSLRRGTTSAAVPSKVVKKLVPGQAGTLRLLQDYGDALVCVRHRHDEHDLFRWTTVELIVDHQPIRGGADPYLWVQIDPTEQELKAAVHQAGGRSGPRERMWRVRRSVVRALGLAGRVIGPVGTKT